MRFTVRSPAAVATAETTIAIYPLACGAAVASRSHAQARIRADKEEPMITVNEVMVRNVVTIDASATLREAAELMRDANVGMLPVMEGDVLRGIVTDRDLVIRGMTRDVSPSEALVEECLSEPPRCAEPDWSLEEAMEEMARQQVGRLPIVDPAGRVLGVVTLSSLALRSPKQHEALETAQEVSRRSARAA
jgi:CBS domain-containing protein